MNIDIDDVIYPQLIISFPAEDAEEILEIIEDLKGSCGIDNPSELEQEIWQRYLALKSEVGAGSPQLPAPSPPAHLSGGWGWDWGGSP